MANLELADDLWTRGAGHLIGTEALIDRARVEAEAIGAPDVDQTVFNGKYSASIHLLIGYSFELLLKCAFVLHGGDERKLGQRGIGHDLVLALTSAEMIGFASTEDNLRWVVERIREPHLRHQFRYGGLDAFHMPTLEVTIPVLQTLVRELRRDLADAFDASDE